MGAGAEGCFLIAFNLSMEMVGVKVTIYRNRFIQLDQSLCNHDLVLFGAISYGKVTTLQNVIPIRRETGVDNYKFFNPCFFYKV